MDLSSRDFSKPLLTYYDAEGGRTELSGATLANWQSKIANLFVDFYEIGPGSRVSISLPSRWIVPAIVGAVGWLDAELVLTSTPGADIDLAVIGPDDLLALPDCPNVVACSLSPLALPFLDPVPAGVDDFFAEVRTQADTFSRSRSNRPFSVIEVAGRRQDLTVPNNLDVIVGGALDAKRILVALSPAADSQSPLGLSALATTCALPAIRETSVVVVAQTPDTDVDHIAEQERVESVITLTGD